MERSDSSAAADRGKVPPYIAYRTFRTFTQDLHEHGVPDRIDRTVLARFSGTVQRQLMTALRFLELIGADDRPTPALAELVDAFPTERWKPVLASTLRGAYGPVMALDLGRATAGQLNEAFSVAYTSKEQVIRKCQAFFLNAAQDAGLEINKRVLDRTRTRAAAPTRRRTSIGKDDTGDGILPAKSEVPPPPPHLGGGNGHDDHRHRSPYYTALTALWACYHPERISEEDEKALLRVFRMLKRQEAGLRDASAHEEFQAETMETPQH